MGIFYRQKRVSPQRSRHMQSRHLYVGSALLLHNRYPVEDKDRVIQYTNDVFDFIQEYMAMPHTGEFYYQVSADGKTVVNGETRMYYTVQAIWGLAHYYLAQKMLGEMDRAEAALQMALGAYQTLHDRLYDSEYGGYDQSKEANWFYDFGRSAYGSPTNWGSGCKGFNSHLHMLEALTGLYLASEDNFIRDMLQQLTDIYMDKQYQGDKPFQNLVMYCNWTGFSDHDVDYPHDMQTAHLLMDAVEALSYTNISKEQIDEKVLQIAEYAQFYGFDRTNGGIFRQGVHQLGPTIYEKDFWAQIESALGFWRAYLVSGDARFLETLQSTLVFYRDFLQMDLGEFYWTLNLYAENYRGTDIYETWKAAYHNMRCMLTMLDEMESFLG
eukprot:TRINITY_DN116_c2_g1_i2.p1 TRINITY_DN116_c2_g1~~TRINITY_DN116_c2_g1_i2.p1  ORF type:complete len:383 (-),score=20.90 TRINITY_DN116_c2_g1_i2:620-1768(-)